MSARVAATDGGVGRGPWPGVAGVRVTDGGTGPRAGPTSPLAWAVALLSLLTVAPLLGWVYGVGAFGTLLRGVALPAMVAVGATAVVLVVRRPTAQLTRALRVGAVAGLVGTAGYDLFRVPFVALGGMRLLSPIETYGVLLADATASSGATAVLGWTYHVANGVLFAVAYAAMAYRRPWVLGLVWALVLETATVATPFADVYGLRGRALPIALAYAAHVPYGLAVGWMVQRGDAVTVWLDRRRFPVAAALAATVLGLAVWLQPWVPATTAPRGADARVVEGRMEPHIVRVAAGACLRVVHTDDGSPPLTTAPVATGTRAVGTARDDVCLPVGVHRLRSTGMPYDGGFVIVDAMAEEVGG